jgi:hypothetical protein
MSVQTLAGGRYRVERTVGQGGMAAVYLAHDEELDRPVAVKILAAHLGDDPTLRERFLREARMAARLSHPNIVQVFDAGEHDGSPFIVMEFVEGETLKDLIRREGPLQAEDLVQVGTQVGDALDSAHRRDLVHRDVKPHNVLLTPEGRVKLADFGIALALGADSATRTGTLLGSVQYLAPEVARGESATPLSDIYALGVVLYEMATGHLPYAGDTPLSIALQHVESEPRRPSELNPSLPPALEAIILRAMAKAPADRFSSAAELADALRAFARGAPMPTLEATQQPAPDTTPADARTVAGAVGATPGAGPLPDEAPTQAWSWGQPMAPSPWATGERAAAAGPAPAGAVAPYATAGARPAPVYPSPRWPLMLLGVVSLLCVLGLVPLGMLAYRQMRVPPATQRVAPAGAVVPVLDGLPIAAQAVTEGWARAARTLVPVPRAGELALAVPDVGDGAAPLWRAVLAHGTALAESGLRAAAEALGPPLAPARAAEACGTGLPATVASAPIQSCAAPETVRGR